MNIIAEATVMGVSVFNKKTRISLAIPSFESDYDTHCTDYPEGMDREVTIGQDYTFQLVRQGMVKKKGSQEPSGDGSRSWHYYWGIVGFSDQAPTAQSAPRESGNGSQSPRPSETPVNMDTQVAIKNRSIERQTAFKGVVDIYVAKLNNGHLGGADMLTLWDDIFKDTDAAADAIRGPEPVPELAEMAAQATVNAREDKTHEEQQQEAFDNLGAAPSGEIGNLGDFLTKAMAEGHGVSSVVLKKLGVKKPVEITEKYPSFDAAWTELVK